jgi:hypothetical protein
MVREVRIFSGAPHLTLLIIFYGSFPITACPLLLLPGYSIKF